MTACAQPGCTGTIDEGYCDLCGHAADPVAAQPQTSAMSAPLSGPLSGPVSGPLSGPVSGPLSRPTGGRLADSLENLPPAPYVEPDDVILSDPQVPEDKRFCTGCGKPVGRSRDGRPGRTDGFCPHCRTAFSFSPKLRPGDLVAGQYRVRGAIAHGGLGWIYLAGDENLDGRIVVLKGLLNTSDPEALAAAEAERRFLTSVDHPNIVDIHTFQRHDGHGYIVMEYVGGQSLLQLRRQGTLPLREALQYGREILRAFGYLHEQGLVYCDLKPANVIRVGRRLKIIDLGAVQRLGSPPGTSWVTVGYHAPELDRLPSSVTSDLYTVARTLAVLAVPGFSPARSGKENPLPDDCGHESFARLLRRATAREPGERFQSAWEMEEQLVGVLREITAAEENVPYPAQSGLFGPERLAAGAALAPEGQGVLPGLDPLRTARAVPVPLVRADDPAAGALASLVGRDPAALVANVEAMPRTPETALAKIRLLAEQGGDSFAAASAELTQAAATQPGDWRLTWYDGVNNLAAGNARAAVKAFDACVSLLPGESAPKLALAFALEASGEDPSPWYRLVWRTDRSHVGAAFGLARTLLGRDDPQGAIDVLDQVPRSSSHRDAAQLACVAIRARRLDSGPDELLGAADRLVELTELDRRRHDRMTAEVMRAGLTCLERVAPLAGSTLAGADFTEPGLRTALEALYRRLAASAGTREERHELVDLANAVRPRSWI
ncbi:tetratricopeptide repeat protein [Nonomuraea longicatena]|uniref:non-specific serine/threonine protein kinase n=1 Tax=Nonomuraea longicatena TaxID=83682 RepID=A0ABN3KRC6_9ACTN